ncbi:hypothetical protein [Streptomyces sp. NPDC007083]|uniref:hypothetical protein n=1 Tax=Streptomyces sp. NPDC007083 TaxID=3156913 RepID=UPI0034108FAE
MNPEKELLALVWAFMSGEDRSMALINKVEGILVEHFPESPAFEELAEPLSLFRPGVGPPYYSVQDMCAALQDAVGGPDPFGVGSG